MDGLPALRRAVRDAPRSARAVTSPVVPMQGAPGKVMLGHAAIDAALGGGLARGRLHELYAPGGGHGASAQGVAAMLAVRAGGALLWLSQLGSGMGGRLHAPGLMEIGLDPARVIAGRLPDTRAVLRAGAEAARCPDLALVVIELWGAAPLLDLTASRRLALAAETGGGLVLLLRVGAAPVPSAARTRWSVAPAPSEPLAADAPGQPAFDLDLLRQRGRAETGRWRVEWNRDRSAFVPARSEPAAPAVPGVVAPASADGSLASRFRRAG